MPILILVMTTMVGGGEETSETAEMFANVWQAISSVSGGNAATEMSLASMCNMNLMYFLIAVFTCIFISDDFRSGYAKNLFTVRA